jgi:uncharacterized alkaline shock family protein YloU
MEGQSLISADILARYAADAACEVDGVRGVVDGPRPRHRGVKVTDVAGTVSLELHLAVDWGANVADVGRSVQARVADYLGRMADVTPASVDVVFDEVGPPAARGT